MTPKQKSIPIYGGKCVNVLKTGTNNKHVIPATNMKFRSFAFVVKFKLGGASFLKMIRPLMV